MMLTAEDAQAVVRYPILRMLWQMRVANDWHFRGMRLKGSGQPILVGFRVWLPENWTDAILIAGEHDARAYRCDPDGDEIWNSEGTLAQVLNAITDQLFPPDDPRAPRRTLRAWVQPICPALELPGGTRD